MPGIGISPITLMLPGSVMLTTTMLCADPSTESTDTNARSNCSSGVMRPSSFLSTPKPLTVTSRRGCAESVTEPSSEKSGPRRSSFESVRFAARSLSETFTTSQ